MTPTPGAAPAGAAAETPAEAPAAGPPVVVGSLSPSRAADFMTCPLRYRFRVVDRLPEPPSPAATRGTVVHAVLERLFDLPPARRTPPAAAALVEPEWARAVEREPALSGMFADGSELRAWLASARELLEGYFALEDPSRLRPAARELYVEHVLDSGLRLRGYLDRLDAAGDALRVVDYKTGRSPGAAFEADAMFQMKFYGLLLWRTRRVVPRELRLYYLGDRAWLRYVPDEADLLATERKLRALWGAIERAYHTGDWRARPSRLCDWCDHQTRCPAFGGTPPPVPRTDPVVLDEPAPAVCEAEG
ncbi:MAG TPA: PD-(D/E)XK nuclease family protein [Frankiaceae bacterium]|nr:PD-(D/E)XK nuclease family protein [Frankiaceae bacterium]